MVLYAGLPVLFALISIIMALTCYRDEPIKFLINRGTDSNTKLHHLRQLIEYIKSAYNSQVLKNMMKLRAQCQPAARKLLGSARLYAVQGTGEQLGSV